MKYKLYSSSVRSRLEVRAPQLEAAGESIEDLKKTNAWRFSPALITDEEGNILEDNGL